MINELETIYYPHSRPYTIPGVVWCLALLTFENATGITPSEIILGLAGWMLIAEHQLPVSMIFVGGLYAALGSTLGASITYWAARLGGRPLVDNLPAGYGLTRPHPARRKPIPPLGRRAGAGRARHARHPHADQHPGRIGTHALFHLLCGHLYWRIHLVHLADWCRLRARTRMDAYQPLSQTILSLPAGRRWLALALYFLVTHLAIPR